MVAGLIPIEFLLFGLTLAGVAIFHHHTLRVALAGLVLITLYKVGFAGFKTGPGLGGLGLHLQHEWVILTNLLGLLLGFALLPTTSSAATCRRCCRTGCRTTGRAASCCWR